MAHVNFVQGDATDEPVYQFQAFPSWRFNAEGKSVKVNDPMEEEALGEGWADSPAAFAPAPVATETKKGKKV